MKRLKSYTIDEALNRLKAYCAYQERCHQDVEKKLREMRMIPEAQMQIINTLIAEGFLNEERFSRSFARGKFRIKKWGKQRIIRELKLRAISIYNIELALKEIDEQTYLDTLDKLVETYLSTTTERNSLKLKKKLLQYLQYRGWESHLVYEKINAIKG